jgi:hypothetical protein
VERVMTIIDEHPEAKASTVVAIELGVSAEPSRSARVEAAWMLVTDLFAASVPVVPCAVLGIAAARITSLAVTGALLTGLGIGRALVG